MAPVRHLPGTLAMLGVALAAAPAAAASDGIEIFPQPVPLAILIALFTVLIWPANHLIWRPLLQLFDERRERIAGTRARAEKLASEAEDVFTAYQSAVERGRLAAEAERSELLESARREQAQVTADARRAAEAEVAAARDAVGTALDAARAKLAAEARELGRDVAAQVLGRPLS